MQQAVFPRLVGDLGGTHARWAVQLAPAQPLQHLRRYACADHASPAALIEHYLSSLDLPRPRQAALGVATAVLDDEVRFVNNGWQFSRKALQSELGLQRLLVLNDFAALAHSLPTLQAQDLRPLGQGVARPEAPRLVIGPGTGLGVAALLPRAGGGHQVVSGEGGHASLAAQSEREAAVIAVLRRRFGHVSAERALSGPGLVNLYQALCELERWPVEPLGSADITARALGAQHALCVEAVELFVAFLGQVAGNAALSFGALGGVYLGGGIPLRLGPLLNAQRLRQHFECKGRLQAYLQQIPIWLITAEEPALQGAANALDS